MKKRLVKRRKKRRQGLSTIVITLIVILVSLVAVGIIWIVVRNVIQSGSQQISMGQFSLSAKIMNVNLEKNLSNVNLTIKRNPGQGEFNNLKFVFYDGQNSEVVEQTAPMKELEERRFNFHLTLVNVSNLMSISVVPIGIQNGKEVIGEVLDKYTVSGNEQPQQPSPGCTPFTGCSALGYVCGNWTNGTCSGALTNCGDCGSLTCSSSGQCISSCIPTTCAASGYECGTPSNGSCSGSLNCNNPGCGSQASCSSGTCVCNSGWGDCNNDNTCECDLASNTCSGGSCVAQTGNDPTLFLWLTFDRLNSTNFIDNSTYSQTLLFYGALTTSNITTGIRGNAVNYSTSNGYISTYDSSLSNNFPCKSGTGTAYNLSIALWIYPYQTSGDLFCKYSGSFCLWSTGGFLKEEISATQSAQTISLNRWNHVALTYDGGNVRLYLNGTLVGTKSYTSGFAASTSPLNIGYAGDLYYGLMDNIRMYNRSLSQAEVQSLYTTLS